MEEVKLERSSKGFAILTLNRPNKLNAISTNMVKELKGKLDQLKDEPLKFLVITGSGNKAFCAGGDLNEFHGELTQKEAYQLLSPMKETLYQLATLPFPTIAWLNGIARGGGLELASACDFRFVSREGTYGFVQGKLGISTGWGGGTLLNERITPEKAFLWLIEADLKSPTELKDIGFVEKILFDVELTENHEAISSFTERSVEQMHLWKKQRLNKIDVQHLKEQMEDEVLACSYLWVSEEHQVAVHQFLNKNSK
ncbi:enoyl-CoA hydratase/isomerase family protein [Aquisalibacillus elongatus]|uniref:Enoyl-CoA hydratase/carnithine racemase n=1 Tax=Aquisalibacillus elongatus TaxID=485577 RepID=A0A3N5BEF6_9BACI|nr:enoyl-CoA hydratase/isomerase family protein [Aquisalibacillus elongatus]RPF56094.1 enoyl-CoA hydratase/carnithine racemase [Aquisalibacillus elongatus]